ncbi:uncharacterized protein LOC112589725 isoform X2 [Harpegnathos saltator]|uniref:uncharacterized protein LOC112589725 isoform X2 n=1 Tax=Harpegnathos saltator TaxID=610380 RepID=UPI000DBEEB91|nr:uncharacterized protein LOC112589725 isoform X2 [Harpegnathos saltator]
MATKMFRNAFGWTHRCVRATEGVNKDQRQSWPQSGKNSSEDIGQLIICLYMAVFCIRMK